MFFSSEFSQTPFGYQPPCKFFAQGTCRRGNQCPFAHYVEQVVQTTTSAKMTIREEPMQESLEICKFFLQGRCFRGDKCKFSHGQTQQKNSPPATTNPLSFIENLSSPSLLERIENEKKSPHKVKVGLDHFDILAQIGDGFVGKVFQVRLKRNDSIYAMKVIPKQTVLESSLVYSVMTERNIMMGLDHPFIIKLHYAFQTSGNLFLIMDFLPGGDLSFHLNNRFVFPEEHARFYAAQIALALQYLHNQNIIYRDLKAANTLLDKDGNIRLADFGMSKLLESVGAEKATNSYCGTMRYMAPEIFQNSQYGVPIDWWSFGVLLFQMLTGSFPFDDEEEDAIPGKVLHDRLNFPNNLSSNAKSLLRGLLDRNPRTRLKGAQVTQHPFFSSIDWRKLYNKEITPPFKPFLENGLLDLSNFPSDMTCTTPTSFNNSFKQTIVEIERFSYCSPTIEGVLAQAMEDNGLDFEVEWEEEEEEEEEETQMTDLIPEEGCFVLTM